MPAEHHVAVIGGGPAGLMAAEELAGAGFAVTVYDRMASVGRKFLLAGRGGLNLTHSEPLETFLTRYRPAPPRLVAAIRDFPPERLRAWCESLGQPTFVGSSGRVFPKAMKASPLLRAWLRRLQGVGVMRRSSAPATASPDGGRCRAASCSRARTAPPLRISRTRPCWRSARRRAGRASAPTWRVGRRAWPAPASRSMSCCSPPTAVSAPTGRRSSAHAAAVPRSSASR